MTSKPAVAATRPTTAMVCARCGREITAGRGFVFAGPEGPLRKCLSCALRHWPMLRRSLLTALVVGSILTAINQGTFIFRGDFPAALFWKVPLTYSVPFCVATWGALTNSRR